MVNSVKSCSITCGLRLNRLYTSVHTRFLYSFRSVTNGLWGAHLCLHCGIKQQLNQTASRFMTQELDRNQYIHMSVCRNFSSWGNVEILLILQVADDGMQMNIHKSFNLSTLHLSVVVESQLSIFCLKCFLHFGYQKCFFS